MKSKLIQSIIILCKFFLVYIASIYIKNNIIRDICDKIFIVLTIRVTFFKIF